MFISACGCGTHVYSTCTGPGHGLRTGACLLHFACVRAVRCSAWIVRAVVYLECVCVCVRQSVCVARLVSLVQRFVCQRGSRALCIVARVGTWCWYLFCTVLRSTRITGAVHTRPCWYLVMVPLLYSASLGQPNAGKCALFSLPLAQFAWVSRVLNILARVGTCAGTSFVQCFAWSAQAMYHLPGLVLVLVSQTRANVPNLPYPLRSSLGYHGR